MVAKSAFESTQTQNAFKTIMFMYICILKTVSVLNDQRERRYACIRGTVKNLKKILTNIHRVVNWF